MFKFKFCIIKKPYNTRFPWSESTKNEISWIYRKTAAILNHFRSCDLCKIVKIEFVIIKNPIILSFISLIALEMRFLEFTAKRRPFWAISGIMMNSNWPNLKSALSKPLLYPLNFFCYYRKLTFHNFEKQEHFLWKTANFSHFLLCDWFEMVKFDFGIIINHIVPIFVDLVAQEMIFLQFTEKRAAIF